MKDLMEKFRPQVMVVIVAIVIVTLAGMRWGGLDAAEAAITPLAMIAVTIINKQKTED